jgi:hypothetical protein
VEKSNRFSVPFDNKIKKGYVAFVLVTHALLCREAIWLAFKTVQSSLHNYVYDSAYDSMYDLLPKVHDN